MILGGGVAGLSAAICARRAGWDAVVVERRERGETSARNAHVHRLPLESQAQLAQILSDRVPDDAGPGAPVGAARGGSLVWTGHQPLACLGELEARLLRSAVETGVQVMFTETAQGLSVAAGAWRLDLDAGSTLEADLLIDASGAHRAAFALLGDGAPDVPLDDIDAPERHVSWSGRAPADDPCLIAWSDQAVEGLLQVASDGHVQLTARAGLDADLSLDRAQEALGGAGGDALSRRLRSIRFEPRGVRHTSPGARRVALDEVDLAALPPLALIGDALIEAPPRYGEGVGRAIEQAQALGVMLQEGRAAQCAVELARQAKAHWAGYGVALSLRPHTPAI